MQKIVNFLDLKISALTSDEMFNIILEFAIAGNRKMITYLDVNCVNISFRDAEYRRILSQADIVHADGQGVVWGSKFLKKPLPERVNPLDFFDALLNIASKKSISFYLLGGKPDVIQNAVDKLKNKFLNLKIIGFHHGYFDKEEEEIIEEIKRLRPNILMVGMGVPKQEKWIYKHLDRLEVNLCLAVGGMFDILSDSLKRAPIWMIDGGLEWLYRLYQEPGRLWKRYLFGNFIFIYRILKWEIDTFLKSKTNCLNNK